MKPKREEKHNPKKIIVNIYPPCLRPNIFAVSVGNIEKCPP